MRGGAPPDLRFADLQTGPLAANTITAFTVLVPPPGATRRLRVWMIAGYFFNTTIIPNRWMEDWAFFGAGSRIGRLSGAAFGMEKLEFPGGIAGGANEDLRVRWMCDVANPQLVAGAWYTVEEV